MDSEKQSFPDKVAEKLIEQLREGTAPWQKPWQPGEASSRLPVNPVTGSRYKGINALHLMSEGREDQRWMTYKQAESLDAQVRKGEKGTAIQYWKFTEDQIQTDTNGKPIFDARGQPVKETVQLERPRVFFATVFNAGQIDGLPPMERKAQNWNPVERAEKILQASGADLRHGQQDSAFYRPATDTIHLPGKEQFPTADNYYATALHELGHWSGHASRLDRDLVHPFGSEGYAREELRAEIASMIMGDEIGIGHDPKQHAAYVDSWIRVLREDPLEIFRAASDAEKIQSYVMGLEKKMVQDEALQNGQQYAERAQQKVVAVAQNRTEVDMGMPRDGADQESLAQRAEAWVLARLEQRTLLRAMDVASDAQLEKISAVLSDMAPPTGDNPFWQRHALPDAGTELPLKIAEAREAAGQRLLDSPLAAARKDLLRQRAGNSAGADEGESLVHESETVLGFSLPQDWSGGIRVEGFGTEMVDGQPSFTTILPKGAEPEGWGVFTEHGDGRHTMVGSYASEQAANAVAERLSLLDAHSTLNEHEAAAKLARINEERVRRDPDSTEEDIAAARELRKNSDFVAVTQDEDLQRRIAAEQEKKVHQAQLDTDAAAGRMLIDVPYKQKDEAKALGAKWDRQEQSWFVPGGLDPAPFARWAPQEREQPAAGLQAPSATAANAPDSLDPPMAQRQYLAVPFDDRAQAKAAGAQWDRSAKSWFAGPDADLPKLEKWKPENVPVQQAPAMTPREEFAEALRSVGCVVSGQHPVMDGDKHRISVEGEKFSQNAGAGFYVGHLDGHPAGYVKNNKTGEEVSWKAKGYVADPAQKALLAAQAASKQQQREAEVARRQEHAAARVVKQVQKLVPVTEPTSYMQAKGIVPHAGALTDKDGKKTYVPAVDADGKQWSMQYIQEDGTKRFAKDSRKDGCFHAVGGIEQLAAAPALVIAEGYATAATLKQALGFATVSAFDAGNLAQVARALHDKFPDKPVIIAGDDDRHLAATQGANPGRTRAEEAASLVGGKVLLPIFAPGENGFPAGVEPVTVSAFRQHRNGLNTLSEDQTGALDRMKQFTDFNDLATRSSLGMAGVERQVRSAINDIVDRHRQAAVQEQEVALTPAQEEAVALKPKRKRAAAIA
ncbi:zincin-like metallopeptidase domain-containing protein [Duganella phyllosphaerae]|uniref:DNA primase TraC n=1 Tax=Duganella phyllosphaerae TaxID=762836 RepID=A0A1E7WFZ5_9BURK|nr:zincin-like metallopeptidase domain-containing protein [Duganella phyllosphaerae]OEZ97395.1 DNA primase TraC [Duganella phyllosphaerae]